MRLRTFLMFAALLALPSLARAQATAQSKVVWDQPAPDLPTATAYTYKHYDDGANTGAALSPVVCAGTASPFVCSAPFPAFTPGVTHTIQVSATNVAGESLKSTPLSFQFIVIPATPQNPRIG